MQLESSVRLVTLSAPVPMLQPYKYHTSDSTVKQHNERVPQALSCLGPRSVRDGLRTIGGANVQRASCGLPAVFGYISFHQEQTHVAVDENALWSGVVCPGQVLYGHRC